MSTCRYKCVFRRMIFVLGLAVPLLAQTPAPAPAAPIITIIGRVADGTTTINAVTTPSATVEIADSGTGSLLALQSGVTATADKSTGQVTLNLAEPLYAGQQLQFKVNASASGGDFNVVSIGGDPNNKTLDVTALGDWGRVRAEFAAGAVLSFDNNFQLFSTPATSGSSSSTAGNSSQSTLFLAFSLDKNWVWAGAKTNTDGSVTPQGHVMFNTFFQTRLTSVPVTVCSTTPAGSTTSGGSGSGSSTSSAGASNPCTTSSGGNLTTFLNSAKSAEFKAGGYLPILTSEWSFHNAPNALFIAPLAFAGFLTPTGSTTSGSTTAAPVNPSNFYNFYGFGGRVGHFKLSADSVKSKSNAPELLSYLDVSFGRYSNLETLEAFPTGERAVRRWRIVLEGVFKVPSTPLVLGFSANVGQNLTGPPTVQAAKDDLRIFVGAKFDVGRLLAKLPAF